jgi:thiosulfate/3-mercaptopyruvate sulfurtransferase
MVIGEVSNFLEVVMFRNCVLLVLVSLFLGNPNAQSQESKSELKTSLLVDVDQLKTLMDHSTTVLLDVRPKMDFDEGHLPKAVWVNLKSWREKSSTVPGLQDKKFWSDEISNLGIDTKSTVIIYGEPLPEAARVWWLLKYCGCQDVRLLDGGTQAWLDSGEKLSKESRHIQPANFEVQFQLKRLATDGDVQELCLVQKTCQLVDNRAPAEFDGTTVRGKRGGHIPGANNLEWSQFIGKDGKFLPAEELLSKIEGANIDLDGTIVSHCQGGGRSSVGAFVFEMLSGKPVRNYYLGWSEWSEKTELPVVK